MAIILYSKLELDLYYMGIFFPADLNIIQIMWIESLKDQIRGTKQPSASAHSYKVFIRGRLMEE